MDEFTRNLVSLSEAHVKVERNLTEPLPSSVEIQRESGEIITISVEYPWVPPTCSHCKDIGHVIRYCPSVAPSWVQKQKTNEKPLPKGHNAETPPFHAPTSSSIPDPGASSGLSSGCSPLPPSPPTSLVSETLPPAVQFSVPQEKTTTNHPIRPQSKAKARKPPTTQNKSTPLRNNSIPISTNPFDILTNQPPPSHIPNPSSETPPSPNVLPNPPNPPTSPLPPSAMQIDPPTSSDPNSPTLANLPHKGEDPNHL
ncbi:PREDICTED: uncharacterized protein LOC104774207 [Camelina sativa]|uniref:Uncharacterized protein LOC104774207 n=1 Tax=Camelina sativa TaxID=90675 RepID=A0ABM0Y8G0_CAMSA|nr:PREDICTED: uncharacterized protein LOC104774207 [Camelina sativa]